MPRALVQRRNPEVTARIAAKHRWHIMVLDWPATARLTVHVIFNPDGETVAQFKTAAAAFGWCIDQGLKTVIVDCVTWGRPFFMTLRREVKPTSVNQLLRMGSAELLEADEPPHSWNDQETAT